jgi:hypothetical protein
MKPLKYYQLNEVNFVTNIRSIIFWPKGHCKYKAILKYSYNDVVSITEFDVDHRVPVTKFGKWIQPKQLLIEDHFYNYVISLRLEALLNNDTKRLNKLLGLPIKGSFNAYVVD